MKDFRNLREEYAAIAAELIDKYAELDYIKYSNVSIGYLGSPWKKISNNKTVYAECSKVPDKYKWSVPFDFLITVFEPNTQDFNDEQMKILIFHELLHVGIVMGADGEEKYSIVPHDLEDFKSIIEKFGVNWSK